MFYSLFTKILAGVSSYVIIDFTELTFDFGEDERTFDTDGEYEIL